MTTDTTERGLESVICRVLTGSSAGAHAAAPDEVRERPGVYAAGWILGDSGALDRRHGCSA